MAKLNIKINRKSGELLSTQVSSQLAEQISSGRLSAGEALPSERALGGQLGVSRNVLRSAYRSLVEQKLIETVTGIGRRVRGAGTSQNTQKGAAQTAAGGTAPKAAQKTTPQQGAAKASTSQQRSAVKKLGATAAQQASSGAKKASTK